MTNVELEKAATWFKSNKLTLNVFKTKFLIFRNKKMHFDVNVCKLKIGSEIWSEKEKIVRINILNF